MKFMKLSVNEKNAWMKFGFGRPGQPSARPA
jgi:hypothetical protein